MIFVNIRSKLGTAQIKKQSDMHPRGLRGIFNLDAKVPPDSLVVPRRVDPEKINSRSYETWNPTGDLMIFPADRRHDAKVPIGP
jgi:hypothetical protein